MHFAVVPILLSALQTLPAQAASSNVPWPEISEAVLALAVAASTVITKRGERKTRDVVKTSVTTAVAQVKADLEPRFDDIDQSLTELRGIVVGPDGKNGLRGQIADIHREMKESKARSHDRNDRLQGAVSSIEKDCAVVEQRVTAIDKRVDGVEKRVDGIETRERA